MTSDWIIDALGPDKVRLAMAEADRRRLRETREPEQTFDLKEPSTVTEEFLRFVAGCMELRVIDFLHGDNTGRMRSAATDAFQLARVLDAPKDPVSEAEAQVWLGCLGVLGDRDADVRRILRPLDLRIPTASEDWGERVWVTVLDLWIRLLRQRGREEFDAIQGGVARIRAEQSEFEPTHLGAAQARMDVRPAWQLIANYHLMKAAELLSEFRHQAASEGPCDIRQQLEAQFDRAVSAAMRGQPPDRETLTRLLARTADTLVGNRISTVK